LINRYGWRNSVLRDLCRQTAKFIQITGGIGDRAGWDDGEPFLERTLLTRTTVFVVAVINNANGRRQIDG